MYVCSSIIIVNILLIASMFYMSCACSSSSCNEYSVMHMHAREFILIICARANLTHAPPLIQCHVREAWCIHIGTSRIGSKLRMRSSFLGSIALLACSVFSIGGKLFSYFTDRESSYTLMSIGMVCSLLTHVCLHMLKP